ncbi:hypothetical protein K6W76_21295 [Burkholderia anthina]|uniref:hypothetical protein n=1 Tax=Burkholderia anthina TaxID=179879 RepID=UPI00158B2BC8|nr:hypothetical protein [Burkholderia anthina]MBY4869016.1 hypothetical protein [Burkholderia anthina]
MSTEQQTQQTSEAGTAGLSTATQPLPFGGVEVELQKANRVADSNVDQASQQAHLHTARSGPGRTTAERSSQSRPDGPR